MKKKLALLLAVAILATGTAAPVQTINAAEPDAAIRIDDAAQDAEETSAINENSDGSTVDEEEQKELSEPEEEQTGSEESATVEELAETEDTNESEEQVPSVMYETHVQKIGWMPEVFDGEVAGTSGQGLRMEALVIHIVNPGDLEGTIEYRAHVEKIGWQDWVSDGSIAGTSGQARRVEAIQIRLTGELAEKYDVYYTTHIQSKGWLDWAKNGEKSGSSGKALRMEALRICLVKKGEAAPGDTSDHYIHNRISYEVHEQGYGWMSAVNDGADGGVTGQSKRLEAFKVSLPEQDYEGGITYRAFVQSIGWQDWKTQGQAAGTTGQGRRVEAVEMKLTGELANYFDVYYSVHMSKVGWTAYAKNGETAGSTDLSKKIEAIRIRLVRKEGIESAPNTSGLKYIKGLTDSDITFNGNIQGSGNSGTLSNGQILGVTGQAKRLETLSIKLNNSESNMPSGAVVYNTHVSNVGWTSDVNNGAVSGSTNGANGLESVKIHLTGDMARYYDIYYRAHVQKLGWMGWAKNGQAAGTTKLGLRLEALQIKLVAKEGTAPGPNTGYYKDTLVVYQNPSQYYQIKDSITLNGGGYNLSVGYEGIKVRRVIQRLGLGNGVGMGGAYYSSTVASSVKTFQRNNGLPQTGVVDLATWKKMGFSEADWYSNGAYASPVKAGTDAVRSQHIEAMIARAYEYLGNPYVIGASGAPGLGVDCSGLVMQALYAGGLEMDDINPVTHAQPGHEYESRNMWNSSKLMKVAYSNRQRGDLIFYQNKNGVVIHVAIYLGNDQVIESWPNAVKIAPIKDGYRSNIKGVARPFV